MPVELSTGVSVEFEGAAPFVKIDVAVLLVSWGLKVTEDHIADVAGAIMLRLEQLAWCVTPQGVWLPEEQETEEPCRGL